MVRTFFDFHRWSAIGIVSLALAGCAGTELALDDTYVPYSPSDRYPIEYAKGPVTMQVDSRSGGLQISQANAVIGFARQSMSGGLTPVNIRRPAGGGTSLAREIADLMVQQGVPQNMVRIGTYPAGASAPVQISYVKSYAHTKACGVWDENLADTGDNERHSNHGCAVQSNIAAVIADPQDLIQPRAMPPANASASTVAVTKLAKGEGVRTETATFTNH